jgi:carbamoyl-phosphate synthase large subunit
VFKIENKRELQLFFRRVDKPILQQFIAGTEYTVDILSDLQAEPLSVVPRTRIHVESGISMKGRTVEDDEIIARSRAIAKQLKLIGPSCIQCIRDTEGIKFIEVNARFGGGSILSMKADPNILLNLIRLIRGEQPTVSKGFKAGMTMLRYYSEVYS